MDRFGRHQAPIVEIDTLAAGEAVFILWGSFANRRGKTLMNRWLGVVFEGGKFQRIEPLTDTLWRTKLGQTEIPNSGDLAPQLIAELGTLRAIAVRESLSYLDAARQEFWQSLAPQLEEQRERLSRLKEKHSRQLQLKFAEFVRSGNPTMKRTQADADTRTPSLTEQRRQQEAQRIDRLFRDYQSWVDRSMTIEEHPYLKLVAVLQGI